MKLKRWALFRGSLETATNGPWVLTTDVKALEKRVAELEKALREIAGYEYGCECGGGSIAKKALEDEE
jgi:hypothetical protein